MVDPLRTSSGLPATCGADISRAAFDSPNAIGLRTFVSEATLVCAAASFEIDADFDAIQPPSRTPHTSTPIRRGRTIVKWILLLEARAKRPGRRITTVA